MKVKVEIFNQDNGESGNQHEGGVFDPFCLLSSALSL